MKQAETYIWILRCLDGISSQYYHNLKITISSLMGNVRCKRIKREKTKETSAIFIFNCLYLISVVISSHQWRAAWLLERIEWESARLAVAGVMAFHHDGKAVGRNEKWSHSQHISMMEGEAVTSTQAQVELELLFELGEMVPQDLQRSRELYASVEKAGNVDGTLHLRMLNRYGLGGLINTAKANVLYSNHKVEGNQSFIERLTELADLGNVTHSSSTPLRGALISRDMGKAISLCSEQSFSYFSICNNLK